MRRQMTISIPDEIYIELQEASRDSLRPLATEAVYRIKAGLRGRIFEKAFKSGAVYDDKEPIGSGVLYRLTLWDRIVRLFKK